MTSGFTGLYARQESLGLNIPACPIIYFTSDTTFDDETVRLLNETLEGLALVGASGAVLVLGAENSASYIEGGRINSWHVDDTITRIQKYRPFFQILVCNINFVLNNPDDFADCDAIVFHRPHEALPKYYSGDNAAKFGGDDEQMQELLENNVVFDFAHMMTGRFTDPIFVLYNNHGKFPSVGVQYDDVRSNRDQDRENPNRNHTHITPPPGSLFFADPDKYWQASSLLIMLGLNIVFKPQKFKTDRFIRATQYLDASVAHVVNSLKIQARLNPKPTAEAEEVEHEAVESN